MVSVAHPKGELPTSNESMSELGQTEKDRHRRRHSRLTSNNGSVYREIGTAGECQGTKSLRSSPLRGARGERPVAS